MKKYILVTLALTGVVGAAESVPIDFSGYFRAGAGINTGGGRQVGMNLNGTRNVETHFRLGDEPDYCIETNFNSRLVKNDDGSEWHVNFMLKNYRGWSDKNVSDSGMGTQGPTTDFAQAYAYGQNIPMLGNGTIWAGRRYYNRVQLGINDHFLENDDGDGGGIDDINVGPAKLDIGFVTDELNNPGGNNDMMMKYVINLKSIPTFGESKLQIHAKFHSQSKTDIRTYDAPTNTTTTTTPAERKSGYSFLLLHETPNLLSGTLSAGLRLSSHIGGNGGHDNSGTMLGKSTLLFAQQSGNINNTGYDVVGEYKQTKYDDTDIKDTWFSLGGRIDVPISGPLRAIAELGTDNVKRTDERSYSFNHVTLAAALNAGPGAGSRPTIRLYYTYGKWNDAVRDAQVGPASGTVHAGKSNGSSIGIQAESWW